MAFAYGQLITHFIIQKSLRIQEKCCGAFRLNVTEAFMPVYITYETAKSMQLLFSLQTTNFFHNCNDLSEIYCSLMGISWVEWKGLKYCLDLSIIRLLLSFGVWVGFEALLTFDDDLVSKICSVMDDTCIM